MTQKQHSGDAFDSDLDLDAPARVLLLGGEQSARSEIEDSLASISDAFDVVVFTEPAEFADDDPGVDTALCLLLANGDNDRDSQWFTAAAELQSRAPGVLVDTASATFDGKFSELAWRHLGAERGDEFHGALDTALRIGHMRLALDQLRDRQSLTQAGIASVLNQDASANAMLDGTTLLEPTPALAGLLGAGSTDQITGADIREWIKKSDSSIFVDVLKRARKNGAPADVVVRIVTGDDADYGVRVSMAPPPRRRGRKAPAGDMQIVVASADNRFRPDLLAYRGHAQIGGRMALHNDLAAPRTQAKGAGFGLVAVQVDRLRELEDAHGPAATDLFAHRLGLALAEALNANDQCYRVDTARYVAFIERDSEEAIAETAQTLQSALTNRTFDEDGDSAATATVSVCHIQLDDSAAAGWNHDERLRRVLRGVEALSRLGGNSYGHHEAVAVIDAEEAEFAGEQNAAVVPAASASEPPAQSAPDPAPVPEDEAEPAAADEEAGADAPEAASDDADTPQRETAGEPVATEEAAAAAAEDEADESAVTDDACPEQAQSTNESEPADADAQAEHDSAVDESEGESTAEQDALGTPALHLVSGNQRGRDSQVETPADSETTADEIPAEPVETGLSLAGDATPDELTEDETSEPAPESETAASTDAPDQPAVPAAEQTGQPLTAANDDTESHEDTPWTEPLREALANDGFSLAYQGVTDLSGTDKPYFDVLLRYIDAEGGLVPAGDFLSDAERSGFMPEIDRWVSGQALEVVAQQRKANKPIGLFVKLSPLMFRQADNFVTWLTEAADSARVERSDLIFSFRESDVAKYGEPIESLIFTLANEGFKTALTHVSSTQEASNLLSRMPFAFVKLSASFAHSIITSDDDRPLTQMVSEMRRHDVPLIAEQIENADAMAKLWQAGINYVQGNFIQEPDTQTFGRQKTQA